MSKKTALPGPISILMIVIVLAAVLTWILPAGQYSKLSLKGNAFEMTSDTTTVALPLTQKTLDSLNIRIAVAKFKNGEIKKPVSVPGTFKSQPRNGQGPLEILQAPIKGIVDSIDIILFVLIIGGFMYVFNETGAMLQGVSSLSHSMKGREHWLIIILTTMFSFLGGSYGMAEEAFVFYAILVPVFLAAGYDLLVPLAVIFGGTMIGGLSGFSNPFSTIIASNAAGINWMDGLYGRLILWAILTAGLVWYILRYAAKVKKNPLESLVLKIDGNVASPYELHVEIENPVALGWKVKLLLFIYISTFLTMIGGVVFLGWWTLEMSALFLASSILVAIITGINEKVFVREFIEGAKSLLSVAFIIGVARGVTVILDEGHIADSILFFTANAVQGMSPELFILLLLLFYFGFSLFIQSSSGMAVLTMPIIGALAVIVNLPGREIVNSYMYGMSLMSFLAPTGLILPSLAMVNVSLKAWFKFITPFLIAITVICIIALVIGVNL
ncbi:MAG: YfcC family protein [Flavobacterium sp.]|uniref:YfcC family protein n=1 Tax=Flavobacterium sp. TaxID=239 RepID=UPI001224014A|nr:YfcC family protein [Flavobacterium sp.]RZJ64521.1 MAG: YfcC family protein [Flavobacterium sp.]